MTAFAGTGAIFLGMAALSSVIKRDLSGLIDDEVIEAAIELVT